MGVTDQELDKYLGSGIAYPIEIVDGRPRIASGSEILKMDIFQLLMTPIGADFFNPARGSRLGELAFELNDDIFKSVARQFVVEAISRWEPRVEFLNADFFFYSDLPQYELKGRSPGRVDITVKYRIKASREVDSLVYPFYRETAA